jgi:hypothetical protein
VRLQVLTIAIIKMAFLFCDVTQCNLVEGSDECMSPGLRAELTQTRKWIRMLLRNVGNV